MEEKYDREIEGERWEQIPNYEGWYDISDFGRVKRVKASMGAVVGRILKQQINQHGYYMSHLSKKNEDRLLATHRLVILAFVGPCPDGKQVNHIDGDKTNNRVDNLEYVTPSENIRHAYRMGLASNQGERSSGNKLIEDNVHEIRRLLLKGYTRRAIAPLFNVSHQTITDISTGKSWFYLKEESEDTIIVDKDKGEQNE